MLVNSLIVNKRKYIKGEINFLTNNSLTEFVKDRYIFLCSNVDKGLISIIMSLETKYSVVLKNILLILDVFKEIK